MILDIIIFAASSPLNFAVTIIMLAVMGKCASMPIIALTSPLEKIVEIIGGTDKNEKNVRHDA